MPEDELPEAPSLYQLGDDEDDLTPPSLCVPLSSRVLPREAQT